ncbi:hypothetical protein JIN85_19985 [Luteolibacter pohnpeiensis]|uniref:Uncharacterized protein n=1 Tax=Luteolibacter pohnpeiensis TaxID=454153 RepID=A0A934S9P4_9BACT|nr:hypothetical protein [Luteolibacter pohnpeiensis]MBK1884702.1 hypothetical protein [Luteolibacter pohnpeiensis]
MSVDQIAAIRPAILEAIEGSPATCATLELEGDADKWVQFTEYTINAAYPHSNNPEECVKSLPSIAGLKLVNWETRTFATFEIPPSDAELVARWIDEYFLKILDCSADYDIDVTIEQL